MDKRLPGFTASFLRFDLAHDPAGGWTLSTIATDDPRFITRSARVEYGPMPWEDVVQVVADVLDSEGENELPDGPF